MGAVIALWVLFSLLCGSFFAMMFTARMEGIKKVVAFVLVAAIVGAALTGAFVLEEVGDEHAWNNGYCDKCNVEWEFTNAQHVKNCGTYYYWTCPDCHTVIELHRQF